MPINLECFWHEVVVGSNAVHSRFIGYYRVNIAKRKVWVGKLVELNFWMMQGQWFLW
jgi:hypothetical protein